MTDSKANIERTLKFLLNYHEVNDDDAYRVAAYHPELDGCFDPSDFRIVLVSKGDDKSSIKQQVNDNNYATPQDLLAASLALVNCFHQLAPSAFEHILEMLHHAQNSHHNN